MNIIPLILVALLAFMKANAFESCSTGDCPAGQFCDFDDQCQPVPDKRPFFGCSYFLPGNNPCPPGTVCSAGGVCKKQKTRSLMVNAFESCHNGRCPAGHFCSQNRCLPWMPAPTGSGSRSIVAPPTEGPTYSCSDHLPIFCPDGYYCNRSGECLKRRDLMGPKKENHAEGRSRNFLRFLELLLRLEEDN